MTPHIWLRSETKENEARCPLTPSDAKKLLKQGFKISVEQYANRIFSTQQYYEAGCEIVREQSWIQADPETIILGLKELPENQDFPLHHRHIYFAHVYKGQNGSQKVLERYHEGRGQLYDLEYLTDDNQRRIAAFGFWAGYVGAAMAMDRYFHKQDPSLTPYPGLKVYPNKEKLLLQIENKRDLAHNQKPKVIIIGSQGRCGSGARELLNNLQISQVTCWDRDETAKGGPFKEIVDHNIFINTVLVTRKIPPFIDRYTLNQNSQLEIIADVSCDPTSDLNPIPLYNCISNWKHPFLKDSDSPVEILAVDNLPSVLPKESSEDFSSQLFPLLLSLKDRENRAMQELPVWKNAHHRFFETMRGYFS